MTEPEQPPVDILAVLRAEIDQAMSMAPELARMVKAHYDAMRSEGFDDRQSLYLAAVRMQGKAEPPS